MDKPKPAHNPMASKKEERAVEKDKLVYSDDADKIVLLAKEAGFSDADILKRLLANVAGVNERKRLLLRWAEPLKREPTELLREAERLGLIPSHHLPPKA